MTERAGSAAGDAEDVFAAAHEAALTYRASLLSRSYRPGQGYRQMCEHFANRFPKRGGAVPL